MGILEKLVDKGDKVLAPFLVFPCVALFIWLIPGFQLTPLAKWGFSEKLDPGVYGLLTSVVGVGIGYAFPPRNASHTTTSKWIVIGALVSLSFPILYNWYSSSPPDSRGYVGYHALCLLLYIFAYAGLGFTLVNIDKILFQTARERLSKKQPEAEKPHQPESPRPVPKA